MILNNIAVGSRYYKCAKSNGIEIGSSGVVNYGLSQTGDLSIMVNFFMTKGFVFFY